MTKAVPSVSIKYEANGASTKFNEMGIHPTQCEPACANTVDNCRKMAFIYSDPVKLLRDIKMFVKHICAGQLFDKPRYQAAFGEKAEFQM